MESGKGTVFKEERISPFKWEERKGVVIITLLSTSETYKGKLEDGKLIFGNGRIFEKDND